MNLGLHEVVVFAVVVQILHLMPIKRNTFDFVSDEKRCSIIEPDRMLRIFACTIRIGCQKCGEPC